MNLCSLTSKGRGVQCGCFAWWQMRDGEHRGAAPESRPRDVHLSAPTRHRTRSAQLRGTGATGLNETPTTSDVRSGTMNGGTTYVEGRTPSLCVRARLSSLAVTRSRRVANYAMLILAQPVRWRSSRPNFLPSFLSVSHPTVCTPSAPPSAPHLLDCSAGCPCVCSNA